MNLPPAKRRDGSPYSGNQRFMGNGFTRSCGKCNKQNNALEALFDEWPAPGAQPPKADAPPVLGLSIDLQGAAKARQDPTQTQTDPDDAVSDAPRGRAATCTVERSALRALLRSCCSLLRRNRPPRRSA